MSMMGAPHTWVGGWRLGFRGSGGWGSGVRVQGFVFRGSGFGVRVSVSGLRIEDFERKY